MSNNDSIIEKLKFRKAKLIEQLGEQIAHVEEIITSISLIEGKEARPALFPPQNPFQGVPIKRVDSETIIRIARTLIGDHQDPNRKPGAEGPDLIAELKYREREVSRIIASIEKETEQLQQRPANPEVRNRLRELSNDRDKLAGELQFYRDLREALEKKYLKVSKEELQEQRNRAKDWAESRKPRR